MQRSISDTSLNIFTQKNTPSHTYDIISARCNALTRPRMHISSFPIHGIFMISLISESFYARPIPPTHMSFTLGVAALMGFRTIGYQKVSQKMWFLPFLWRGGCVVGQWIAKKLGTEGRGRPPLERGPYSEHEHKRERELEQRTPLVNSSALNYERIPTVPHSWLVPRPKVNARVRASWAREKWKTCRRLPCPIELAS